VLNGGPVPDELSQVGTQAPVQGFAYLVNRSIPNHLPAASCVYFDGAPEDVPIAGIVDLVEAWFANHKRKSKVLIVRSNEKVPRYSIRSLRNAAEEEPEALRRSIKSIEFFPEGRTTVERTWHPSVYAVVSFEHPVSVMFTVNQELSDSELSHWLKIGDKTIRACAAYGFWFPERCSPLGYYWGIVVKPAGRDVVSWGAMESRRLSHWRDNVSIGIAGEAERHFFGACDGFVRDVYPLMLLNEAHMRRPVGGLSLLERIREGDLGVVTVTGDKLLWRIPRQKLVVAQALLDENDVTLSGRRLEGAVRGSPR
jgi:hypothetical protein